MGKTQNYIKQRTLDLYDSLPPEKDDRIKCKAVRDEIIELNYKFFGFVASSTYVDNTTYEDKFQSAVLAFMNMWWKFHHREYRSDLSFSSFFGCRLSEEVRRALSPVSYTVRRQLCMKAAEQLGKPWTQVSYEDIGNIQLPPNDMIALKAVLGASKPADISEFELYLEAPTNTHGIERYSTDKFDTVEELLIQEMVDTESPIDDKKLRKMSELYTIDYLTLKSALPRALEILHKRLTDNL